MRVAQDLYEGIDLGDEGAVGLITYMRTDSTRVAESAVDAGARLSSRRCSASSYLPRAPQLYGTRKAKHAQDAHESVRPTDPDAPPGARPAAI